MVVPKLDDDKALFEKMVVSKNQSIKKLVAKDFQGRRQKT